MGIVILQSKNVSSQHIVHRKLTQSHGSIIFNKNNFENRIVRNFTGSSPCVCMRVHLDEPRPPSSCSHGRYYGTPPLGARSLGPHTYLPSALVPPPLAPPREVLLLQGPLEKNGYEAIGLTTGSPLPHLGLRPDITLT